MTPFQENEMRMFDEKFPSFNGTGAPFPIFKENPNRNHIVQFLLLHDQRFIEYLIERIEKMKLNFQDSVSGCGCHQCRQISSYNQALTTINSTLEELK